MSNLYLRQKWRKKATDSYDESESRVTRNCAMAEMSYSHCPKSKET